MKPVTILKKARGLIVDEGWCQGALARNKWRHAVNHDSKGAVRFCVYGALYKAAGVKTSGKTPPEVTIAEDFLKSQLPTHWDSWTRQLDIFNDAEGTRAKDVVELLDRAIKEAKKVG